MKDEINKLATELLNNEDYIGFYIKVVETNGSHLAYDIPDTTTANNSMYLNDLQNLPLVEESHHIYSYTSKDGKALGGIVHAMNEAKKDLLRNLNTGNFIFPENQLIKTENITKGYIQLVLKDPPFKK